MAEFITRIGPKSVLSIISAFPRLQLLPILSLEELANTFPAPLVKRLGEGLTTGWRSVFARAQEAINQHIEKGIFPLPITSSKYPVLLKLIADPPPILYIKGNGDILNNIPTIAIIGTREATTRGLETTRTIAYECARRGCVIVSGLTKGTDTAAHRGAIAADGKTIAVFATPLDTVYPAENKKLAEQIWQEAGVLISEYPIGTETRKGFFVARDRIQSGISLGVIPVQTDINGGTMHTVRHAREQQRPLFCPVPPEEEKQHVKYRGILKLLGQMHDEKNIDKTKRTINPFPLDNPRTYDRLLERLEEQRVRLLTGQSAYIPAPHSSTVMHSLPVSPVISIQPQEDQGVPEQLLPISVHTTKAQMIEQPSFAAESSDNNIPAVDGPTASSDKPRGTKAVNPPTITNAASAYNVLQEVDNAELADRHTIAEIPAPLGPVEPSATVLEQPTPARSTKTSAQTTTAEAEVNGMNMSEAVSTAIDSEHTFTAESTKHTPINECERNAVQPTSLQEGTAGPSTEASTAEISSGMLHADHPLHVQIEPELAAQKAPRIDIHQTQEAVCAASSDAIKMTLPMNEQRNTPGDEANAVETKPIDPQEELANATNKQEEPNTPLSMMRDTALNAPQKPSTKRSAGSRTGTLAEKTATNNSLKRQSPGQQSTSKLDQTAQNIPSEQSKKRKKKSSDVSVEASNRGKTASNIVPQPDTDSNVPKRRGKSKTAQEKPELWDNTTINTHASVSNN